MTDRGTLRRKIDDMKRRIADNDLSAHDRIYYRKCLERLFEDLALIPDCEIEEKERDPLEKYSELRLYANYDELHKGEVIAHPRFFLTCKCGYRPPDAYLTSEQAHKALKQHLIANGII